jgi:hypothetical protein
MIAHGEVPMVDAAIFADTGAEPGPVYRHLDWLEQQLPFPVHRVSAGNLREQIIHATEGKGRMDARPPFFVASGGMLHRQCTQDFKILPIIKKVRELIGLKRGARGPKVAVAEQLIGISLDEFTRMKPSRLSYIRHSWPLVDNRITRSDCLRWLSSRGFPIPPKSACTFCPYHDDSMWRDMKANDPESFSDAVRIDAAIRSGVLAQRSKTEWFVHRSLKPLSEVDFRSAEDAGQGTLFNEECEGMCGV